MSDFNPNVIPMFMWRWSAELYAWRARRAGYAATVKYEGSNWLQNGGRWGVSLKKEIK